MLRLYNAKGEYAGILARAINQHRRRTLADGDETLDFECPHGEDTEKIEVEGYVQTDKQEYVIKSVTKETSSTTAYVECALNIEALEGKAIPGGFETVEKTLSECMDVALSGTGWGCRVDPKITKRRTVRIEEDTNAWKIIKAAVSTYKVEIRVETLEKCVYFVETRGEDKGCYFYEGLNLRSLGIQESSYGFYTRLIPIGKDGLHLSIDGKNYIENHQYSTKTITAVWRDERYTNTTDLYEDAVARLEEASRPVTAYAGDLIDLAKQSGKYKVLDYDLGDVIILASRSMDVWEKQRIVQIEEYDDWKKNAVELSSTVKTFAQIQKEGDDQAKKETISVTGRIFQEKLNDGLGANAAEIEKTKESIRQASASLTADIEDVRAGLYTIVTADDIEGFKEGKTTLFAQIQDDKQALQAGIDARVTSLEFGQYKEAVVNTYATIEDVDAGLRSKASVQYVDDTFYTKTAANELTATVGDIRSGLNTLAQESLSKDKADRIYLTQTAAAGLYAIAENVNSSLALKAEKSTVTELDRRISTVETATADLSASVDDVNASLSLKAEKSTVTELDGRVSAVETATTRLTTRVGNAEADIALKADKSAVNAVNGRLATVETATTGLIARVGDTEASLKLKASQSEVDGISESVATLSADVIELQGHVDVLGKLSVSGNIITIGGGIKTQQDVESEIGKIKSMQINTNEITARHLSIGGYAYAPTEITSTTSAVMALGIA